MKRIFVLMLVIGVILLLSPLFSSGSTVSYPVLRVTITPTVFNYLPFVAKNSTPTPTITPTPTPTHTSPVIDVYMTNQSGSNPPGPRVTRFPSGTTIVYIYFDLDWSMTTARSITFRILDSAENVVHEVTPSYLVGGHKWGTIGFCRPSCPSEQAWPAGSYRTEILIDGVLERTLSWTVE